MCRLEKEMLVDSHCHLSAEAFPETEIPALLARAKAAGVARVLCLNSANTGEDLAAVLALSSRHKAITPVLGYHPHEASKVDEPALRTLAEALRRGACSALGEIGLDFHHDLSPRPVQREVFAAQLDLAAKLRLPVVVHCRDAFDEVYAMLAAHVRDELGVMHCYTGDKAWAKRFLDLGMSLSLAGVVTFKGGGGLEEVARYVPDGRLLVESDAPYLAPVPCRGKRNEPAFVVHTAARLAELRGVPLEVLAVSTTACAERLFRLAPECIDSRDRTS